jgi:hypothetical protein
MKTFTCHLTFVVDTLYDNNVDVDGIPYSEGDQTIAYWLESALDDVLSRSFLREIYLFSQIIDVR